MRLGVPVLLEKIAKCKPKIVCFVGVGIADTVASYLAVKKGWTASAWKKGSKGGPGLIPFKLVYPSVAKAEGGEGEEQKGEVETLLYAVSSTSGRVVAYKVRNPFFSLVMGYIEGDVHRKRTKSSSSRRSRLSSPKYKVECTRRARK